MTTASAPWPAACRTLSSSLPGTNSSDRIGVGWRSAMASSSDGRADNECQQQPETWPGSVEKVNRTAAELRRHLDHPVIDADGHFLEFMPLVDDDVVTELETVGGPELRDRYRNGALRLLDTAVFEADRRRSEVVTSWQAMPSWWGNPVANGLERA